MLFVFQNPGLNLMDFSDIIVEQEKQSSDIIRPLVCGRIIYTRVYLDICIKIPCVTLQRPFSPEDPTVSLGRLF